VIRHTRISHFGAPLGFAALALAFKVLNDANSSSLLFSGVSSTVFGQVSDALGITSASIFVFFGIFYIIKSTLYPKKVIKEWRHPTTGSMFSAVTICLSVYGILMYAHNTYNGFGITLVWIAASCQMLMSILVVGRLIFESHSDEVINSSILMGE
jgi:tellurite resistance protein TehA-like permease